MVTAASSADAAVVLVDATKLRVAATRRWNCCRRRAAIRCWCNLLRVPSIVFAVNKLDAVEDPTLAFDNISARAGGLRRGRRHRRSRAIVPISALKGHNVVDAPAGLVRLRGPVAAAMLEQLRRHRRPKPPKPSPSRCSGSRSSPSSVRHLARAAACSGAASPPAACEPGQQRHACCPAARPRRWRRCWTTRASPAHVPRRPQRRHRAGPRSGRVARRLAAGARRLRALARDLRPPSPGWTTSRWWPAASTGRCMATAGSRPRSSASCTSWTSTRWPKKTPTSWSPTPSATSSWPAGAAGHPALRALAHAGLAGAGGHGHPQDLGRRAGSLTSTALPPGRKGQLKSRVSPTFHPSTTT